MNLDDFKNSEEFKDISKDRFDELVTAVRNRRDSIRGTHQYSNLNHYFEYLKGSDSELNRFILQFIRTPLSTDPSASINEMFINCLLYDIRVDQTKVIFNQQTLNYESLAMDGYIYYLPLNIITSDSNVNISRRKLEGFTQKFRAGVYSLNFMLDKFLSIGDVGNSQMFERIKWNEEGNLVESTTLPTMLIMRRQLYFHLFPDREF